jgi:hypothetical protein
LNEQEEIEQNMQGVGIFAFVAVSVGELIKGNASKAVICGKLFQSGKLFLHILIKQWYKFKNLLLKFLNLYHCFSDENVQEKFFTFFEEGPKYYYLKWN